MGSSFAGIRIGLRSLDAFRMAQEVIGQNIANASNESYARRRVNFEAIHAAQSVVSGRRLEVGAGVRVASITRIRNSFADVQYRERTAQAEARDSVVDYLAPAESIVNPLSDTGLRSRIEDFRVAFEGLAAEPTLESARLGVIETGAALARALNEAVKDIEGLRSDAQGGVGNAVDRANALLKKIYTTGREIIKFESDGQEAAELRDERDAALDELATLVGFTTVEEQKSFVLFINKRAVVSRDRLETLEVDVTGASDPAVSVLLKTTQQTINIAEGEIGGLLSVRAGRLKQLREDIKSLRTSIASAVNTPHKTGYNQNGILSGQEFFVVDASTGEISVNSLIVSDPKLVAAAQSSSVGDNANARAIADAIGLDLGSGKSAVETLDGVSASFANDLLSERTSQETSRALSDAARNRRRETMGVSLDEEMGDLIIHQQSYRAMARYIAIADEMLEEMLAAV